MKHLKWVDQEHTNVAKGLNGLMLGYMSDNLVTTCIISKIVC